MDQFEEIPPPGPPRLGNPRASACETLGKASKAAVPPCVAQGCPFALRRVHRISHFRRAPAAAQNTSAYKSRLPQEPPHYQERRWAARAAAAASTRAGATARRPAACCPSRLYWVIGTGTTAARTGTTTNNKDSGASPSTPTATRPSCSSRIIGGEGSPSPSLHY